MFQAAVEIAWIVLVLAIVAAWTAMATRGLQRTADRMSARERRRWKRQARSNRARGLPPPPPPPDWRVSW